MGKMWALTLTPPQSTVAGNIYWQHWPTSTKVVFTKTFQVPGKSGDIWYFMDFKVIFCNVPMILWHFFSLSLEYSGGVFSGRIDRIIPVHLIMWQQLTWAQRFSLQTHPPLVDGDVLLWNYHLYLMIYLIIFDSTNLRLVRAPAYPVLVGWTIEHSLIHLCCN